MENYYIKNKLKLSKKDIVITILIALLVVLFYIIIILNFNLTTIEKLVLSWILTTAYSIFGIFMVGDKISMLKVVEKPIYYEKPVIKEIIKEVPIQIPIENKTIEVVEKPVIHEVIKEVPVIQEKIVYLKQDRKTEKLNIPKYNFLASTVSKKYHKKSCRLSKLIKKKYKVQNNSEIFFKNRKYSPCKICIKN